MAPRTHGTAGMFSLGLLLLLAAPAQTRNTTPHSDPVYPEDGSIRMAAWHTNTGQPSNAVNLTALGEVLSREGIALRDISYDYEWIQDVALFTSGGTLLLQAAMPDDPGILGRLTAGVLNDAEGTPDPMRITRLHAKELDLPYRRMTWTFVEGGELITGRFANGETYAIMDRDALERTQSYYLSQTEKDLSETAARRLIANDLGIPPANLFFVFTGGTHLDLMLLALPGGTLLLDDPGKNLRVIDGLLSRKLPKGEESRLRRMKALYAGRYHRTDYLVSLLDAPNKPTRSTVRPYAPGWPQILNDAQDALNPRFRVVRVAGVFREFLADSGAPPEENDGTDEPEDSINFFNGFIGRGRSGKPFAVTNNGYGISVLEQYWREVLSQQGIEPERVHFVGRYSDGAGIDCAGAPSGGAN